ncbi:hypothetical protein DHEL01_v208682 [Diaporthe helianthi]|uniref:Uncharacterized protein n=1 Tax=Diaporthe helianthi TaxID=158607 RepID=A0A2P5HRM8_DIAHE|nr:hypothetical protein DHEL01_v208682 [Diaporthe helianthi]
MAGTLDGNLSALPITFHSDLLKWAVIEAAEHTAQNGNTASQCTGESMQPLRSGEKPKVDMIGARVTGAAPPGFVVQMQGNNKSGHH